MSAAVLPRMLLSCGILLRVTVNLHSNVNSYSCFGTDAIQWAYVVSPWSSQSLHLLAMLRENTFALVGLLASL